MGVWSVLLAIAVIVLRANSAPPEPGLFPTNDAAIISQETGLMASAYDKGFSLKLEQTTTSNPFALAIGKKQFVIGIRVPSQTVRTTLTFAVTNPKTRYSLRIKLNLQVNDQGLGHALLALDDKYLGGFEKQFTQFAVTSEGNLVNVGSTRSTSFDAYSYAVPYNTERNYFLMTLSSENLPPRSEVMFETDVIFLTSKPPSDISTLLPSPFLQSTPLPQLDETEAPSAASEAAANASFWKSKWWVVVICVVVLLLLIGAAITGGVFGIKKVKSRMTEKSKSKGPAAGPTEDSDALSNMPSTTVQPYVKPSDGDTVYENKSKKQNTTRQSVRTETTEQKDTTIEPDTTTQTQTSVATKTVVATKVTDVPTAPAAKPDQKVQPIAGSADPNYQTLAAVNGTNKAPAVTMPKEAPKKPDPNYQRIDGVSDESVMKSKKAGKTPAANTTKATPKKPDGNYQTLASLKGPKLSADSTGDKAPSQKTDKTASKKQKRMFFKRTTGTDDYPDTDQEKAPSTKTDK